MNDLSEQKTHRLGPALSCSNWESFPPCVFAKPQWEQLEADDDITGLARAAVLCIKYILFPDKRSDGLGPEW